MSKGMAIATIFFLGVFSGTSQPVNYNSPAPVKNTTKGWLYGSFGWHRIYYTNSTIRFQSKKTADYDFRLIKAKAIDDNDIRVGRGIDAPQWSLRFGYINQRKSWGIELNYDHAKYLLKRGQTVRIQGTINGIYYNKDTVIDPDFLQYEHTDGANYYMLNFLKRQKLSKDSREKHELDILFKAGAGLVIPRTESRIMGNSYNEHYHISGYVAGIESSLRYEPVRNIFAELSVKGVFARYSDVLLYGNGRASQQWWSGQWLFTLAYQLPVKKGY